MNSEQKQNRQNWPGTQNMFTNLTPALLVLMVHYDAADVSGERAVCRSTSVAKL